MTCALKHRVANHRKTNSCIVLKGSKKKTKQMRANIFWMHLKIRTYSASCSVEVISSIESTILLKKMKGMTYFVNHNLYKSWDVRGVFKRFLKYITWQWVYRNFGEIFCLRIVKKYLPIDPVSKCCLYNLLEQNNYPSSEPQISIRRIKQISRT